MRIPEEVTAGFIVCLFIAGGVFGVWKLDKYLDNRRCDAKTEHMGFNHSYDPWTDCIIEVEPGKWIPLDSYYYKEE